TVAFCMGPSGLVSRYLAGRNGAPWTYASFSGGRTLAPGMVSYEQLRAWRYDAVGPDTRLFAVLGDPIAQSLSPAVHNAAIENAGLDAAYVPIRLSKDEFEEGVETLAEVGFGGFSVTIPHKEAALAWAESRDPAATRIGAANTLVRGDDGKWTASNTDLPAALSSLVDAMRTTDPAATLERKTALVLGAGGVTRAVASGLMDAGAVVTICGRTAEKAAALAEELGCVSVTWENRSARRYDIVVNGTPVGMHPEPDAAPLPENAVADGAVVFDTIYNPENTLLLKRAQARGAATVSGVEMFVRQAAAQFRAFHDVDPPVEVMREAFRRGISAVKR
ncbi:MAG: shikimate dehydrogenase, partial [Planctomycetota bacterium]